MQMKRGLRLLLAAAATAYAEVDVEAIDVSE
jgi:hypothetical protein